MSFSGEVKSELSEQKIKKYCCRNYFLLGLLADCSLTEKDGKTFGIYSTASEEICTLVEKSLGSIWKTQPNCSETVKMNTPIYMLEFELNERSELLKKLDSNEDGKLFDNCCESCKKNFIKGAFVSLATISDPSSGYHLEFRFKNAYRAKLLYSILGEESTEPKIVNRRNGVGLYYKSSVAIEDILTYLGNVKCVFDFINVKIERDLRNSVNRSTNCVAGNISKSVNAAQKHISAINELEAAGKLGMLPDDLFETAKLRRDMPSASLAELARAHNPPISKSGLTHRLSKISEYAEEIKNTGAKQ